MNCEIIDKETGDRVNLVAGAMAIVGSLALLGMFIARVSQELKKTNEKAPAAQVQILKSKASSR